MNLPQLILPKLQRIGLPMPYIVGTGLAPVLAQLAPVLAVVVLSFPKTRSELALVNLLCER
jgi:hypothetical protein